MKRIAPGAPLLRVHSCQLPRAAPARSIQLAKDSITEPKGRKTWGGRRRSQAAWNGTRLRRRGRSHPKGRVFGRSQGGRRGRRKKPCHIWPHSAATVSSDRHRPSMPVGPTGTKRPEDGKLTPAMFGSCVKRIGWRIDRAFGVYPVRVHEDG